MTGRLSPYRTVRDVLESLIDKMERGNYPQYLSREECDVVARLAQEELSEMDDDWAEAMG